MEMESQHEHDGHKKKSKRKWRKSKAMCEDFLEKAVTPDVAAAYNDKGENVVKKKSKRKKKKRKKSKECDEDTTEISCLLNAILARYISDDVSVSCTIGNAAKEKSKKRKVQDDEPDHRNGTDTGGSSVKEKTKNIKEKSKQRDEERGRDVNETTALCNGDGESISKKKYTPREDHSGRTEIGGTPVMHSDPSTEISGTPVMHSNPSTEISGTPVIHSNPSTEISGTPVLRSNPLNSNSPKKKSKKKNGKDMENPSSSKEKEDVSAAGLSFSSQDSCASTSKHPDAPGKTPCKYKPTEEVLNTDDFTEEQRIANEYVLSGKYLPTVTECLNNDFGEGRRPYVPQFKGDPICPYCHKIFVQNSWRDHHVRAVHLKIKKLKCNWCGKRFAEGENLKVHEYMHMDAKPFPCIYCDKVFRYGSHRWRHVRTHMKHWCGTLDGIVTDRRKRRKAQESDSKEVKVKVEESSESDGESDLVKKLSNTQSKVFNDIKESFNSTGIK